MNLENCGKHNHAIIAYGWNFSDGGEVISLRNSWGSNWGENGNMRVFYEEAGNTCWITNFANLPIF